MKPKSTQVKIAEGDANKIGKKKLQEKLEQEPKPASGLPECPAHLTGRAKAAWEFWAAELAVMEIDKRPDAAMLEGACQSYAHAVRADTILQREPLVIREYDVDKEGKKFLKRSKVNPAVTVSNSCWTQVRQFCSEFGFSPSARTRIAVDNGKNTEEDLATLLAQPRPIKPAAPPAQTESTSLVQ